MDIAADGTLPFLHTETPFMVKVNIDKVQAPGDSTPGIPRLASVKMDLFLFFEPRSRIGEQFMGIF